ncbi:MAG: hypothetical protein Q8P12_04370, partial [bacterium]|nr:hypothetical protein [bacterium]
MPVSRRVLWMVLGALVAVNGALFSAWALNAGVFSSQDTNGNYSEASFLEDKSWSFKEYAQYFYDLAQEKGAAYAYQVLKVAPIVPGTDMHLLGHVVADEIYKQEGVEGIAFCDHDFRNACSHAIVVGVFLEQGLGGLEEIRQACLKAPGGKGAYGMCFHGLGHGVLAYHEYNMENAVATCKELEVTTGRAEFIECTGGIVMEMMSGVNDREAWERESPRYLSKEDPLNPCNLDFMVKEARPMCYNYLTPRLFEAVGTSLASPKPEDYKKAFPLCELIPEEEPENRTACYGGFGKEFVVLSKDRDVRNIENMSDEELSRVYDWCLLANSAFGLES